MAIASRKILFGFVFGCVLLLMATALQAQVFVLKVGPHGDYSTIQAALSVVPTGSTGFIWVERGTTYPPVVINSSLTGCNLEISGGWDSSFSSQATDPSLTTVDGGSQSRVFYIVPSGGTLTLKYLTISGGRTTTELGGAGIFTSPSQDGRVILDTCVIKNNFSQYTGARGGGLFAVLDAQDALEVHDCAFFYNTSDSSAGGSARGGGAYIQGSTESTAWIEGSDFHSNHVIGGVQAYGGGLAFSLSGSAEALVESSSVYSNDGPALVSSVVVGAEFSVSDTATAEIRSTDFRENNLTTKTVSVSSVYQVEGNASGSGVIILGSSVVARGDANGLRLYAADTAWIKTTNLTVTANTEDGFNVYQPSGTKVDIYNSIAYGNGTDLHNLSIPAFQSNNLIGVDPIFTDTGCGIFSVPASSPAVNAGSNSPSATLGAVDVEGKTRVIGSAVDIGAYELSAQIFSDGFESCDTSAWSYSSPLSKNSCP